MQPKDKIIVEGVSFFYGRNRVLNDITVNFTEHTITAIMGASGQGKSTFLGLFNRLWDDVADARVEGKILIRLADKWVSPMSGDLPLPLLRRKVGMIFQEPNPLPMSIARNMAFPLKLAGIRDKSIIEARMHQALEQAFLWEEVKDRLEKSALDLSGGQKQRLCVARALVLEPEVLLCDEPTSSLDAKASGVIEELLVHLKSQCTILAVSHKPEQVRRIADRILALQEGGILPMEAGYKLMDKNNNFKTDRD
jgi:phosphate transport system ATP-binding protein